MDDVPDSEPEGHLQSDPQPDRSVTVSELITQLSSGVVASMRDSITSQHHQPASLTYTVSGLCQENQQLSADLTSLQQDLADLKLYLREFQADHKTLLTAQDELKKENDKLRTDITSVTTDRSDVNKMQSQLNDTVEEMTSLREEMTSLREEMRSQRQDLHRCDEANAALRNENRQLRADLSALRSNDVQLRDEHSTLHAALTNVQAQHGALARKQTATQEEVSVLQTQQGNLRAEADAVRTAQTTVHADLARLQGETIDPVLAQHRLLQQELAVLTSAVDTMRAGEEGTQAAALLQSLEELVTSSLDSRLGKARELFDAGGVDKFRTKQRRPMIFRETKLNAGGHFNEDTGVFTAPQAGLYHFTAAVAARKRGATVSGLIMVGEVGEPGEARCVVVGGVEGGMGGVMARLKAGHKVWVLVAKPEDEYAASHAGPLHGWRYFSHFGGALVLPL